jgi:hypothetical protein
VIEITAGDRRPSDIPAVVTGWSLASTGKGKMNMNANLHRELSTDELDRLAGGFGMLIMVAVEQALKAPSDGGGRGQAEKRLQDHRNEMRRNWAP